MERTLCTNCRHHGYAGFDGKCSECGTELDLGENMDREELKNLLPLPEEQAEVEAELPEGEEAVEACEEEEDLHCTFCGFDFVEAVDTCPRCATPQLIEDEHEDDGEEDGEEGDEDEKEKKLLLDKSKKLSAEEEARFYMDLASVMEERQISELAAQIVWGEEESIPVKAPRWVPEPYKEDWDKAVDAGKPKTMLSAVSCFRGVIGAKGGSDAS